MLMAKGFNVNGILNESKGYTPETEADNELVLCSCYYPESLMGTTVFRREKLSITFPKNSRKSLKITGAADRRLDDC
ncbi:hypothetical protein CEXT_599911 [Caerostris extrusa]|uniref:Uncharacterized protein n=1 Tax=Caerostris extrusa TaxID=172846 RepID=A0AAV4XSY1_CAEEX|nr:hypothetical protein CEXT_599911 [Caerostris extrusa]